MQSILNFRNQFLIAMPQLADPHFAHTLTYVAEHNDQGAIGLTINRLSTINIGDILEQFKIKPTSTTLDLATPIYTGGPVNPERGFILHPNENFSWASTIKVTAQLCITTSRDVLEAIAMGKGPSQYLFALGYAAWEAKQLEQEMSANAWLNTPCNEHIIFNVPPEQRWQAAALQIGVDLRFMSRHVGHA